MAYEELLTWVSAGKSTFNFNGTAPQIIEMGDPSDLRYSDIKVSNTSNASLGSNRYPQLM